MPRQTPRHAGFTIIELMVAISIMTLLMFLVHQLFTETSRAVSTGMKSGIIFVESETFGDQLERDAARMIPPDGDTTVAPVDDSLPAGVLVIVQRVVEDVPVMSDGNEQFQDNIRTDQLIFFINGGGSDTLQSITPDDATTFGGSRTGQYARVWYGHAQRADFDGTPAGLIGEPGLNWRASSWILGRQQLLLLPSTTGIAADGATWDATVSSSPASRLIDGLTDVAAYPLTSNTGDSVVGDLNDNESVVADYRSLVYDIALPDPTMGSGPFPSLLVNPTPAPMNFDALQIAQMHGQLAGNVSDFIVEFAGDYDASDGIDRDSDGNIKWYGHFYNNEDEGWWGDGGVGPHNEHEPKVYQITPADLDDGGRNTAYYDESGPNAVFVFRHDDEPVTGDVDYQSQWPHLIRVRYRVHDARGLVQSTVGEGVPEVGRWFEHVIRVQREP